MDPEELKKLQEERAAALVASLREEFAKGEQRSGERIEALQKELTEKVAALESEVAAQRKQFSVPGSGDEHDGEKFSFSRCFSAIATNNWDKAGLEKEIMDSLREKTMATTPDSSGGFLIPTEVLTDQIIPLLYAKTTVIEAGATVISGLSAIPTNIPRVSGGTTGFWVGENATITASDMTTQQLALTPHIAATLTAFSDLLGSVGAPGIDNMIRSDMARQIALQIDLGALKGLGASGQPTGVLNTTGISTITWSAAAGATWNSAMSAISALRGANALDGSIAWIMSNAEMLAIEQSTDLEGTNGSVQDTTRRSLFERLPDGNMMFAGYKAFVSTQLADGANPLEIILGNWADLIIATWGGMKVDTTNAVGFTSGQNHIRTMSYVDIGVRHAASFVTDDVT